ncbi:unnamed protein product [Rhodiola kirilowii]
MGWGNIYKRRMKVFAAALFIYLDYKALQHREKWTNKSKRAAMWERAHERNANRVLNLMIELEGLWVKLGQYLSTRADVLPDAYITLLRQLQDSLPPRPLKEVYRTIQNEMGKAANELFLKFVEEPLATASIAQVHRATLKDGQEVVVKVQHEDIKAIILEDLKNAKAIVDWIAWAEPQYNFSPMIDEWCKEEPKELDFNIEAESTRKVAKNLGCRSDSASHTSTNRVDVRIPEIIQSTEKVLILEYMDGIRLSDSASLDAYGVDRQKVISEITRAYAHQIFVDGFFNGDPHPGNFLITKEPPNRPILLDFGLTKSLSHAVKQALAKMFLASAEGDQVALLSAFAEMGLRLRLDIPEQAMEITTVFFRASTPANEAAENLKTMSEQRTKNMKVLQDKLNLNKKEVKKFNPVDAFPGDIVIFARVLNLLRGLSSTMNARIVYLDIMRPFAESVLHGSINNGPAGNPKWVYETPVLSSAEAKLRDLLVELGNDDKILGTQVCAYKDGKVIIDTSAGVLGRYDPRPVKPDSLFSVFSVTKGIAAGMVHWLVDQGKLRLDENIADIWPEFRTNNKEQIKVHHVLNHTSGLHNALAGIVREDPLLMTNWDECLNRIASAVPETEPGVEQLYHILSFGWLCGGIMEHASGMKFQEILEEAFIRPLNLEGELYVGIPPGVESRLATLTPDMAEINKFLENQNSGVSVPAVPEGMVQLATSLPALFNTLNVRRAIIPAANGHCSARALARYYAAMADGGKVPPPHSSSYDVPLGSHPIVPKFPSQKKSGKHKGNKIGFIKAALKAKPDSDSKSFRKDTYTELPTDVAMDNNSPSASSYGTTTQNVFKNPKIHDACLGIGEYSNLALPNGAFGLGFKRHTSKDGSFIGFGHSGLGGSTGYCDLKNRFSIAVTLNQISFGGTTAKIIKLVTEELNLPLPDDYAKFFQGGPDEGRPLIN